MKVRNREIFVGKEDVVTLVNDCLMVLHESAWKIFVNTRDDTVYVSSIDNELLLTLHVGEYVDIEHYSDENDCSVKSSIQFNKSNIRIGTSEHSTIGDYNPDSEFSLVVCGETLLDSFGETYAVMDVRSESPTPVLIYGKWISVEDLCRNYVHEDGTPIDIKR